MVGAVIRGQNSYRPPTWSCHLFLSLKTHNVSHAFKGGNWINILCTGNEREGKLKRVSPPQLRLRMICIQSPRWDSWLFNSPNHLRFDWRVLSFDDLHLTFNVPPLLLMCDLSICGPGLIVVFLGRQLSEEKTNLIDTNENNSHASNDVFSLRADGTNFW